MLKKSRFMFLAISLATVGILGVGCAPEPPEVSAQIQEYYDSYANKPMTLAPNKPTPEAPAAPVHIDPALLEPGTKSVFFGDSWTAGYAAEPSAQGYAYLTSSTLGWANDVLGLSGTGYLNPGPKGEGTFLQRLEQMPVRDDVQVFVIQGSINDGNKALFQLKDAADAALTMAQAKFPAAQIVVLGPAPALVPVSSAVSVIDQTLRTVSAERGLPYVSPIAEDWINVQNYDEIIDGTKTNHPDTNGHLYLSKRLVQSLRALAG